jgi:hypothetical protein
VIVCGSTVSLDRAEAFKMVHFLERDHEDHAVARQLRRRIERRLDRGRSVAMIVNRRELDMMLLAVVADRGDE